MSLTVLRKTCTVAFFILFISNIALAQPANDGVSGAIELISGLSPTSVPGNLYSGGAATGTPGINTFCTATNTAGDVWYYFVARTASPTVSLKNIGNSGSTNLSNSNGIQIFNSNSKDASIISTISVATLNNNSVDCRFNSGGATTSSLTPASALVVGNIYLIRVFTKSTINSTSSAWAFKIEVTDPLIRGGRSNEVFQQTILSGSGALNYPWEITYGPDNKLWITESQGYKVYRMDPNTGAKTVVLDLSSGSTWLPSPLDSLNAVNTSTWRSGPGNVGKWPQGGLAGLAIHPKFPDSSYVYVSYVHRHLYGTTSVKTGIGFRNKLVRFKYDAVSGKLGSPQIVCDSLPGSSDHNSQRMIIAKNAGDTAYYLYYAEGDMGAGQYDNRDRPNKAQNPASYEGKILRFNLSPDADGGGNAWIPNDNPYNSKLGYQTAVYCIGIRNNQGFAYDTAKRILYGSSHGPYSDDEINIIEPFRNYGHPLVIGFAADGNYNGTTAQPSNTSVTAGAPYTDNLGRSSIAPIGNEMLNKAAIDASGNGLYKDPLFSAYAVPNGDINTAGTIKYIWKNNPGNMLPAPGWPSEAWSGLDLYSNTLIPGWKGSLVAASLKWCRLVRLKLDASGTATAPSNTENDTITYFNSQNRFRDLAFSPDGKDIFVVMDNYSTTSGPGSDNPVVPNCPGCVQKYTFLGYNSDASGKSTISNAIDVAGGTVNACQNGTTITINYENANLWVPITGQDGNILAEIKANGNILGTVTSSFYTKAGSLRETSAKKLYASRNITITPQNQPTSPVDIRLYLTAAEYNALRTSTNSQGNASGVNSIADVVILKNTDACGSALVSAPITITPQYAEAFGSNYVLQGSISSFSSFYLGSPNSGVLPLQLLTFTGTLQDNNAALLQWTTTNEVNTSHFVVERSTDGNSFSNIGIVNNIGDRDSKTSYAFTDANAGALSTTIVYYRLKIFDNDGKYSYSKIVNVPLNKNMDVMLYPNPVKQILSVRLIGREVNPVMVQIVDLTGRVIHSDRRMINQSSTINIDVKHWKPQVYILKVINWKNEVLSTQKFEKM